MRCHFCPSFRGILKRVIFNNTETIWVLSLLCSFIPSARHGPTPSYTKRTTGGCTTTRNILPARLVDFGSTFSAKMKRFARSAKIRAGIRSRYSFLDTVYVLYLPKILSLQLCKDCWHYSRSLKYAVFCIFIKVR